MARDESKDTVTVMFPMLRQTQKQLREIHKHAVQQDPRVEGDYRKFAAIVFGTFVAQMHKSVVGEPLIQEPGAIVLPTNRGQWQPPTDPMANLRGRV